MAVSGGNARQSVTVRSTALVGRSAFENLSTKSITNLRAKFLGSSKRPELITHQTPCHVRAPHTREYRQELQRKTLFGFIALHFGQAQPSLTAFLSVSSRAAFHSAAENPMRGERDD